MQDSIHINRFLPIAILYFFLNSFLLPHGLLYTTLLTPLFLVWLYKYPSFNLLWIFFLVSIPYIIIHILEGIDVAAYIKSYLLLFSVFVFCLAFYQFLKRNHSLGTIFRQLTVINFLFVLVAIVIFPIPGLKDFLWYQNAITGRVTNVYRLKLLTYEASYYSMLLAPIALFYYLKMILQQQQNKFLTFLIITLPLVLSLSFGVIAGILLALLLLLCSDIKLFTYNRKFPRYLILGLTLLLAGLFIMVQFFPDNVLFIRIANIFKGHDSSFKGRTFDSLYLGWELAAQKNIFFGCGPGQIKIVGVEIFNSFYKHIFTPEQLAVPNSFGDTMATFGLLGVLIKLALVIFFFFRTRVYSNYYRLSLFLFIFIYQFTGSYLTNIAEYVIWIMAFYQPLFPEFNKASSYFKNQDRTQDIPDGQSVVNEKNTER